MLNLGAEESRRLAAADKTRFPKVRSAGLGIDKVGRDKRCHISQLAKIQKQAWITHHARRRKWNEKFYPLWQQLLQTCDKYSARGRGTWASHGIRRVYSYTRYAYGDSWKATRGGYIFRLADDFYVVAMDGATSENRFQIDIESLRESYDRG